MSDERQTARPFHVAEQGLQSAEYHVCVLLVGEQASVAGEISRFLSNESHLEFHHCANPIIAIELAAQLHPTVILHDLVKTDAQVFTAIDQLRSSPATNDIPIIILSPTENASVRSRAFALGANDFLVKLPDKTELVARLRYHSKAYSNQLQRDAAYRALRESQRQWVESNAALVALNQKLEEATLAKSEFLTNMSHEKIRRASCRERV